jgi:uncharacterized protein YecE (DUF72 family)
MEFGKIPSDEVKIINFDLPEDGQQTAKVLHDPAGGKADVFVGCAKWGLPEWVNFLYPPKTKAANFLEEHARHFNSIELNAAYYKIPAIDTVRKWRQQVAKYAGKDFLFCPKFPESVSHYKRLKGAERATDEFLSSIVEFGDNLGPCFLQMSETFGPDNLVVLEQFLKALPTDLNVFVELRHEGWFSDQLIRKRVFEMFTELNKGAVITDVSGRRDILHMEVTVPEVFIRFIGNGAEHREGNMARIDEWAIRLKSWQDKGLKKIYFFLHQHDERESVQLAIYAGKVFNKTLGSQIPEIRLQPSLFI